jgi:hypothetical protein
MANCWQRAQTLDPVDFVDAAHRRRHLHEHFGGSLIGLNSKLTYILIGQKTCDFLEQIRNCPVIVDTSCLSFAWLELESHSKLLEVALYLGAMRPLRFENSGRFELAWR